MCRNSSARSRLDERPVDCSTVSGLASRHHQEHVHVSERRTGRGPVGVVAHTDIRRPGGCTRRVSNQDHGVEVSDPLRDKRSE